MVLFGLDQQIVSRLQPFLHSGERPYWVGSPRTSAVFSKADFFLVPATLVWSGGFFYSFFISGGPDSEDGQFATTMIRIVIIVFSAWGLVGRFAFNWWRNRNTFFGVTDQRVMVMLSLPGLSRFRSLRIPDIDGMQQDLSKGGHGSLIFGKHPSSAGWFANSGLNPFQASKDLPLAFTNIVDVRQVDELIRRLALELENTD